MKFWLALIERLISLVIYKGVIEKCLKSIEEKLKSSNIYDNINVTKEIQSRLQEIETKNINRRL